VRLPPQSPNLNAHLERFWRSLREECLDRLIFFGEEMLRRTVKEYVSHFHGERNHPHRSSDSRSAAQRLRSTVRLIFVHGQAAGKNL
jgi:hypothetical protein